MRRLYTKLFFIMVAAFCFAQTNPLYQLPESRPAKKAGAAAAPLLVGTDSGLYRVLPDGGSAPLWTEGKVSQIVRTEVPGADGKTAPRWYFVTARGIVTSTDLKTFAECNNGLPALTIKQYADGKKTLSQQTTLLKDLCADPLDPSILVTATKDAVFITRDGGGSWTSLGSTSRNTAGLKAVAVAHMPVYAKDGSLDGTELVVFMSHPIYGFSYCRPDAKAVRWTDVSAGFGFMPSLTQPDEVSDILPVLCKDGDGNVFVEVYCSQTFIPAIYRFDWRNKRAARIYAAGQDLDTIDALYQVNDRLLFTTVGGVASVALADGSVQPMPAAYEEWKQRLFQTGSPVNAAYVPAGDAGFDTGVQLGELWMLTPNASLSKYDRQATDKKAIYISAYQVRNMAGITKYRNLVAKNNLNAVVVDMKDDYGLLRFTPNSPLLKEKGFVTQYKIDVDQFVGEFKKDGVYLIGRVVVFKDKNLAEYGGGKYAIWNSATQRPWVGSKGTQEVTDADGNVTGTKTLYYDENWVDPYSEEVWEYNVEIAKELVARGFDEVQFDYIRFPTDGLNMRYATYRWRDPGMDKESALTSFLAYARANIDAPIGIDIYGANGWYRSGTRTGQDVELMSDYVDVICPMFYPSHFEQNFMEYSPVAERPYRIYFYGTYRNTVIGRNRVIVRPWVQAFYMNVRYDRAYYDKNYVRREIFGVRDGVDRGYMYWNNSGGNYDDISPDPTAEVISPWRGNEADLQKRLPVFSTENQVEIPMVPPVDPQKELALARQRSADFLSILDSILYMDLEDEPSAASANLLMVRPYYWGRLKR